MRFDCAVFDLDGTLVDSQSMWTLAKTKVLTDRGFVLSREETLHIMTMEFPEILHALSTEWPTGLTPEEVLAEITETVKFHYASTIPPKAGVVDLLDRLESMGVVRCLATASWEERFMPLLRRLELDRRLDHIVTAAMVGRNKHFPDVFLEAARRAGADPARTVVFEDSLYSVKAAKQAGFYVVGIHEPASDGSEEVMRSLCDGYIQDFTCLPQNFWQD